VDEPAGHRRGRAAPRHLGGRDQLVDRERV